MASVYSRFAALVRVGSGVRAGFYLRFNPQMEPVACIYVCKDLSSRRHSQGDGIDQGPTNSLYATGIGIGQYAAPGNLTSLNGAAVTPAGGDQPHNNLQPYLTFYFCIALQGSFRHGRSGIKRIEHV